LRGVLDGHVVLDRTIAERGRFPAVDLLRSVSRSLPTAATDQENLLIAEARTMMGAYDRAEMMIQAGLYAPGADPTIDAAIACHVPLERFMSQRVQGGLTSSFAALRKALSYARPMQRNGSKP
jgi:flagellum-specific ATP synthase